MRVFEAYSSLSDIISDEELGVMIHQTGSNVIETLSFSLYLTQSHIAVMSSTSPCLSPE